ncbi:hypothetical protein DJFAAGMI_01269 [Comamonas sp. PE63]|uniref:BrnA antitoxin family protein n=1 Tax=Comamonas brasiliensis TaxID=1812482 RepID=A0ABS5LPW3_9BURK|nr:BrnA antitoxin family protein [Comamonas sp. PE63]MBS3018537.1 hypothetical protein [Comamonas sp. PE63]
MVKSLKALQGINTEKLAAAIEADAGQAVPGLRESLADLRAGNFAAIHTPEQIAARKPGRPVGSIKANAKVPTNIRLDPDVLQALKASGKNWQRRVNDLLRADIEAGRLKPTAETR